MGCSLKIVFLISTLVFSQQCSGTKIFAGLFPNSAQYRIFPYTFTPKHLQNIIGRMDLLLYSYGHFKPENFQILYSDPQDKFFVEEIMKYKRIYPELKVILSIGGDNFPSFYFSAMAASNTTRSAFISSLQEFLQEKKFDGVDISWKWPCSSEQIIYNREYKNIILACDSFEEIYDKGSRCPEDGKNFLLFLRDLRQALGKSTVITVTGSASPKLFKQLPLKFCAKYVDYWLVQTYEYTASATNTSEVTAPSAPLRRPTKSSAFTSQNINNTVRAYLKMGFPAAKLVLGIPLHGNLWYVPGSKNIKWQEFGIQASVQGKCCGPYRHTYGGKHGRGSQRCGSYMFSEILAASDMQYFYDRNTQTAIGYMHWNSSDEWTEAGTWFSYSDRNSVQAITQFIKKKGLGGAYASDVSADSINLSTKCFTFELMGAIYNGLQGGGGGSNICNPTVGCNVCTTCCRSYLTNQFDCNACVILKCSNS